MKQVAQGGRRQKVVAVRNALRQVRSGLSTLNRQVSAHLSLKDVDLECLDVVGMHGPLSPTQLAVLANVHPATMTGILDRLERGGWIVRERGGTDRRAVFVKAQRSRTAEVYHLLAPMNQALEDICADYSDAELELLADFLRRVAVAGQDAATTRLSEPKPLQPPS